MIFQRFKTRGIAHLAYLIGDQGAAALVDPRRDIAEYLAFARENDLVLKYVLETHRQEDFVIGSKAIAEAVGAKVVTGDHPLFGHSDRRLRDDEALTLGALTIRPLRTPGHTPESTSYALFVADAPGRALGVFTGDALFIGETGRTDLSDPRKTGEHAGQLYDAVHATLLPLGDQAILWPAHGSGSVCGGNIAARDDSTIGLERAYNPVFTASRAEFVAAKIRERIPRPPYFAHMEQVNHRGGMPPREGASGVALLDPKELASAMKQGIVIDTRDPEAFAGGHIPNSINVWLKGLSTFGGWLANETSRIYLVVRDTGDVETAVTDLARIGVDGVEGALAGGFEAWRDAGLPLARSATIDATTLARDLATTTVLDVREDSEFEDEGHIEGAYHLYVGYLDEHLDRIAGDLQKKPRIAVTCSVGHRAGIAASLLERHGFGDVMNLLGGMSAWRKLALPTKKGRERSISTPDVEGERR